MHKIRICSSSFPLFSYAMQDIILFAIVKNASRRWSVAWTEIHVQRKVEVSYPPRHMLASFLFTAQKKKFSLLPCMPKDTKASFNRRSSFPLKLRCDGSEK